MRSLWDSMQLGTKGQIFKNLICSLTLEKSSQWFQLDIKCCASQTRYNPTANAERISTQAKEINVARATPVILAPNFRCTGISICTIEMVSRRASGMSGSQPVHSMCTHPPAPWVWFSKRTCPVSGTHSLSKQELIRAHPTYPTLAPAAGQSKLELSAQIFCLPSGTHAGPGLRIAQCSCSVLQRISVQGGP